MTEIIESLSAISQDYDVLYCDLWGCVHDGLKVYPAAVAALEAFRAKGGVVVLMTNAPRTQAAVTRRLERMEMPRSAYDLIVSSGDATQEALLTGAIGSKVWHLGPEKDEDLFTEIPAELSHLTPPERVELAEAEGIVCTGPFDEYNEQPEDYRGRFLLAKTRDLVMLSANPDLMVDVGEKRIPCGGALAALYEEMGGEVMSFGKPFPPIYDLARRKLGAMGITVENERILAIGDGYRTDIAGAMGEGIDALFVTGGLETARFGNDPEAPEQAPLEAWLQEMNLTPRYSIGRLR